MGAHELDNPILASLRTRHRALALRHGDVLRYPPQLAPFLAVPDEDSDADAALAALVAPGDTVYLVGPCPRTPAGWRRQGPEMLAQMVCAQPLPELPGAPIVELTEAQHPAILALAALVYPHYFRPGTPLLGRYFGILEHGRLAAMVGERMGTEHWREVSAVCAHPDTSGRGYARRLLVWLSNDLLARGQTPFLHVSLANQRAMDLYLRNGYQVRCELPHWSLGRDG